MNRTRYWLSSKKLQMAQLKDLSRQLQEAWDEQERLDNAFDWASMQATECEEQRDYLQDQLHRVARERDNERKLRLEAEGKLQDYHLDKREKDEEGRAADRGWLDTTDNEEE